MVYGLDAVRNYMYEELRCLSWEPGGLLRAHAKRQGCQVFRNNAKIDEELPFLPARRLHHASTKVQWSQGLR